MLKDQREQETVFVEFKEHEDRWWRQMSAIFFESIVIIIWHKSNGLISGIWFKIRHEIVQANETLFPLLKLLVGIKHLGSRAGIEITRHPEEKIRYFLFYLTLPFQCKVWTVCKQAHIRKQVRYFSPPAQYKVLKIMPPLKQTRTRRIFNEFYSNILLSAQGWRD